MAKALEKSAPAPVLHIAGLRVLRGDVVILDDVDWRIEPSQHWVLLGANGCGKTSLLKGLLGYLTPSAGAIRVLGREYGKCDWRDLRSLIGIVSSALHLTIPVEEPALATVASGARAQLDLWGEPTPTETRAALRQLRRAGADHLTRRSWGTLSQGERQRVLIARALMAHPRLLILDEPCAGMDPVTRAEFLARMEALTREPRGPNLVLVTHHVEEITPGFSHALLLRAGRVTAAGKLNNVLNNRNLTHAFGAKISLRQHHDHLELRVLQ